MQKADELEEDNPFLHLRNTSSVDFLKAFLIETSVSILLNCIDSALFPLISEGTSGR